MARKAVPKRQPKWSRLTDAELLETPLKSLNLKIEGTWLKSCLRELDRELAARDLLVRPHAWLSDEFFSPQDTPGFAIPFYLAHPRLMRIERKMMLEVEAGTRRECMMLLRHEAAHVVQYAFGLHRRRRWRELFGSATEPYPDHYKVNPTSRRYVQHLPRWYAQCHPDEDFAETFSVWLTPRSNWRKRYADWPALKKLLYVDELMGEIAGVKPVAKKRIEVEPLRSLRGTLGEHYAAKRKRYAIDMPSVFDRDLTRIFSDDPGDRTAPLASAIVRRNRARLIRSVSKQTGEYRVALDAALDDMARRCKTLGLRAPGSERQLRKDLTAMLSSKAIHSHYSTTRRQWFAV